MRRCRQWVDPAFKQQKAAVSGDVFLQGGGVILWSFTERVQVTHAEGGGRGLRAGGRMWVSGNWVCCRLSVSFFLIRKKTQC